MISRSVVLFARSIVLLSLALLASTTLCTTSSADLPVTFQGEVDSDGPLVIDPHTDDLPGTVTIQNAGTTVYLIQRMPQTKSVTSLSFGEFGQGSCSSGSPKARLWIYDRPSHDFNGSSTTIAYTNEVDLPATPDRLDFSLEYVAGGGSVAVMKAGHTYTFYLGVSGCSSFQYKTWAAVEPKVETPNGQCVSGVPYRNGSYNANRQWHDALNAASPFCVNYPSDFASTIWPYAPEGWLVSISPGPTPLLAMYQNIGNTPPDQDAPCGDSSWGHIGITQENVLANTGWEGDPTHGYHHVMQTDGLCTWNSFLPPGQQSRYAWSTALPMRPEYEGLPRLPYLRLDTVDWDNTLLQRFAPAMKYDSSESYLAQSVDGVTWLGLAPPDCSNDANSLNNRLGPGFLDTRYAIAASDDCPTADRFTLDALGPAGSDYPYADHTKPGDPYALISADDYIDLRNGDYAGDAAAISAFPGWNNTSYRRVFQGPDGDLWLQYFFWYYYNDGLVFGVDNHEGDWEGIQLHLPTPLASNPVPDRATYNQHTWRETCGWSDVEKAGGHPVVYSSAGRHGSYFRNTNMPSTSSLSEDFSDAGPTDPSTQLTVHPVTSHTPSWMLWPGRWGASTGGFGTGASPTGPTTFHSWDDPLGWDTTYNSDERLTEPCADPAAQTSRARKRRPARWTHRTAGNGPGPRLRWTRAGAGAVRVSWTLPRGGSRGRPLGLILSTRATTMLAPAVTRSFKVGAKRSGSLLMKLPAARGPYQLVGRVVSAKHGTSAETTRPIPSR
jgi:hypothetical protein